MSLQDAAGNSFVQDMVFRKASGSGGGGSASFDTATSGPGGAIPFKAQMESAFGEDFSSVRAHTGQSSSLSDIGASAAAQGEEVAFASPSPDTETVAHELTHVVQARQSGGAAVQNKSAISSPGSAPEREADSVASVVASGGPAPEISASPSAAIHRDGELAPVEETPEVAPEIAPEVEETPLEEVPEVDEEEVQHSLESLEDLLSYGVFDWAITDSDAWAALGLLAGLSMPNLEATIERLGQTFITRLLDNLPSSARVGASYTKVLVALGPQRIQPYLNEVLSTGFFDWMVTAADIRAVCEVLQVFPDDQAIDLIWNLPSGQRDALMSGLNTAQRRAILARMGTGAGMSDTQKALARMMFFSAPEGEVDFLTACFSQRFAMTMATAGGASWDAASLRQAWTVLEGLPESHVAGNPDLLRWVREMEEEGDAAGGWYDGGATLSDGSANPDYRSMGMDWDTDELDALNNAADEGDPLWEVNRFNKVLRHEVGHAVDEQINASNTYCIGNAAGGDWREYQSNYATVAAEMVAQANAGINAAPADAKAEILAVIVQAMSGRDASTLEADIQGISKWADLTTEQQEAVLADKTIRALTIGLNAPWYNAADGGVDMGGRIYQESYENSWVSYDKAARARKVSLYQFRAPGEWFAEAYATYYQPTAEDGSSDGSLLAGVDAAAKAWFDNNVATMQNRR